MHCRTYYFTETPTIRGTLCVPMSQHSMCVFVCLVSQQAQSKREHNRWSQILTTKSSLFVCGSPGPAEINASSVFFKPVLPRKIDKINWNNVEQITFSCMWQVYLHPYLLFLSGSYHPPLACMCVLCGLLFVTVCLCVLSSNLCSAPSN